jgi:MFS family permease
MKNNLKVSLITTSLTLSWFWYGIWIPYYLLFTNYAGIGIVEMVAIASAFIFEIPTGAFADLLGKKRTLQLSFLFVALGNLIMAMSLKFPHLLLSVFIIALGNTLLSGTNQAMIFDSLKATHDESSYEKFLTKINSISITSMAFASIVGGFLYGINPRIPFYATAFASLLALFIAFLYEEPKIDTIKFSFSNYFRQNKVGFTELFKKSVSRSWIIKLLLITSFIVILNSIFDNALAINFGYKEKGLGILFAIAIFLAALGNHFYLKIKSVLGDKKLILLVIITLIASAIISPFVGIIVGTVSLMIRFFIYPFADIQASNSINKYVESKYRATTLSTFTMLYKLPYVLTAVIVGSMIDSLGAKSAVFYISILFTAIALLIYMVPKKQQASVN